MQSRGAAVLSGCAQKARPARRQADRQAAGRVAAMLGRPACSGGGRRLRTVQEWQPSRSESAKGTGREEALRPPPGEWEEDSRRRRTFDRSRRLACVGAALARGVGGSRTGCAPLRAVRGIAVHAGEVCARMCACVSLGARARARARSLACVRVLRACVRACVRAYVRACTNGKGNRRDVLNCPHHHGRCHANHSLKWRQTAGCSLACVVAGPFLLL